MRDGLGRATYGYDTLSRLTSETRQLPTGTYGFTYTYNLADGLTGVTDHNFGANVGYGYDEAGQVRWRHADPVTGSERWTAAGSEAVSVRTSTEPDPLGVDAGVVDWASLGAERQAGEEFVARRYGDSLNLSVGCEDGAGRGVGTLRQHPGSLTVYAATRSEYDRMGRLARRYNPVEVSVDSNDLSRAGLWAPAGDDANPDGRAGWAYSAREYDWKGRVRREVNADATTVEADYGGCGCAGGEVVTTRDEVGRRRKVS